MMNRHILKSFVALVSSLILLTLGAATTEALSFPDSLWIGTDTDANKSVLNVSKTGILLRTGGNLDVTGIAIDLASNIIYYGSAFTGPGSTPQITPRNLDSLAQTGASFGSVRSEEDMAFDGSSIWRVGFSGFVQRFNPSTGAVLSSFSVGFNAVGIAWDGSNLWISNFLTAEVVQFTTAGTATGLSFFAGSGCCTFGLAWDTTDNTMWVGQTGQVSHFTTSGMFLGGFGLPDNRQADGLEYQGFSSAVPEPSSLLLVASALAGLLGMAARRRDG